VACLYQVVGIENKSLAKSEPIAQRFASGELTWELPQAGRVNGSVRSKARNSVNGMLDAYYFQTRFGGELLTPETRRSTRV
jgi:hypothetical protein